MPPDPSTHQPSTDKSFHPSVRESYYHLFFFFLFLPEERRGDGEGEEEAEQKGAAAEGAHTLLEGEPSS